LQVASDKRNQGVLHKYITEAAEEVLTKGLRLSERLYVPEPFRESTHAETARRRRSKLAVLESPQDGHQFNMALVLGEFKGSEAGDAGRRIWIQHMPDAPLFIEATAWGRIVRAYGNFLQARDADTDHKPRVVMGALIYAKREHMYQVDAASFILTTDQWIPIEGLHELGLISALIEQRRRFIKPLRYDAKSAAAFPNARLLDAGEKPVPLHVVSAFIDAKERATKEKTLNAGAYPQASDEYCFRCSFNLRFIGKWQYVVRFRHRRPAAARCGFDNQGELHGHDQEQEKEIPD